jgi:hypothetical protein
MSSVAEITNAHSTASGVKELANSVAVEAEGVEAQVRQFLHQRQSGISPYCKAKDELPRGLQSVRQ